MKPAGRLVWWKGRGLWVRLTGLQILALLCDLGKSWSFLRLDFFLCNNEDANINYLSGFFQTKMKEGLLKHPTQSLAHSRGLANFCCPSAISNSCFRNQYHFSFFPSTSFVLTSAFHLLACLVLEHVFILWCPASLSWKAGLWVLGNIWHPNALLGEVLQMPGARFSLNASSSQLQDLKANESR